MGPKRITRGKRPPPPALKPSFTGPVDDQGKPHGFGTLIYHSGEKFIGNFVHGVKSGEGTHTLPNGDIFQGLFADNELNGEGTWESNGDIIHGHFTDGSLHGQAIEKDITSGKIHFEGQYKKNERDGPAMIHMDDGGRYEVQYERGKITGDGVYLFPDHKHCLKGTWKDGEMWEAYYYLLERSGDEENASQRRYHRIEGQGKPCKFDSSTSKVISTSCMQIDYYEQSLVHVKKSTLPEAGDGLFAKVLIPPDTVVSFYNGVRMPDYKNSCKRPNAISLEDDMIIDVPKPFDQLDKYCASVGHKCNHSFTPNAKYDLYDHPRFGFIRCIRSLERQILPDEEIFVCYAYSVKNGVPEGPDWYLKQWEEFVNSPQVHSEHACKTCFPLNTNKKKKKKSKHKEKEVTLP